MARLEGTLRTLLSPFDSPSVDAWRSKVNREVQELLGADMVTFHLAAREAPEFYSEQLSPESLGAYPAHRSGLEARFSTLQRAVALGVYSRAAVYYPHWKDVERSAYYHDFIVPNRAYDAIAITTENRSDGAHGTVSGLLLYHEKPRGKRFGRRGLSILGLLMPAFRCGTQAYLQLAAHRANFTAEVDALAEGAVLADGEGRILHRNAALERMLALDPEQKLISDRMNHVAGTLARFATTRRAPTGDPLVRPMVSDLATALARYRVRGIYLASPGDGCGTPVLVTLERLSAELPDIGAVQERFGLTNRESGVALLLARGRSNAAVARALGISPHTARHHTESVLAKLGVHRRGDVEPTIRRATGTPS